jgi:hypothetical protein
VLTTDVTRKHVKRDLDAYVCLFDRCDQPYDIFSTSKEWLRHMRSEHLVKWRCAAIDHGTVEFGTKEELMGHMNESHPGTFSSELLPYMMEACRRTSEVSFDSCPFCGEKPNAIEEHVGHHLRYLTLKSIPWPENGIDVEEEINESEYLVLADKNVERETVGQSFGSFRRGSFHFGDQNGSIASDYSGDSFFDLPEQRKSARPEFDNARHGDDDRQAEWGFVKKNLRPTSGVEGHHGHCTFTL